MSDLPSPVSYLDAGALVHLTRGLTFDLPQITGVFDGALAGLNEQTGFMDKFTAWIAAGGHAAGPCPLDPIGRIIVEIVQMGDGKGGKPAYIATVRRKADEKHMAPVVFFEMHSPVLDIPMRLEAPLRALLRGNPPLAGTYTLYAHYLLTDRGETYTYYGITKRGWSLRFNEHTRAAFKQKSKRLLVRTLDTLTQARTDQLYGGIDDDRPKLAGIISTVCGTGLDRDGALDAEERLVDKYSLASKHPHGLNMIPGGIAGLRQARHFLRKAQ